MWTTSAAMPKMWISLSLMVAILVGLTTSSSYSPLTKQISECAAKGGECDESKGRPVCGTDNQTYPTRCHLIRAQCSGHQVSLKHRGTCKAQCIESRAYALVHRDSSPNKFVPRCRADGSYAAVQCMDKAGCWCSDAQGKPIDNTTTRSGKPNCQKKGKNTIRRNIPPHGLNRQRRGCTRNDQAMFNSNLISVFHSEHERFSQQQQQQQPGGHHGKLPIMGSSAVNEKGVLDWKFSMLDLNGNHQLDKIEYRELKRLVKKVVKPKRCARSFGKFCDIDNDDRLSRKEWANCLSINLENNVNQPPIDQPQTSRAGGEGGGGGGVSGNQYVFGEPGGGGGGRGGGLLDRGGLGRNGGVQDVTDTGDDEEDDDYNDESAEDELLGFGPFNDMNSKLPLTPQPPITVLLPSNDADPERTSENESDCLSDRIVALDEQKSHLTTYVPVCTPDGRFQRVQCYQSVGYCWCVNEDTGKNIPGTSVKDARPNCSVNTTRPMKGCPEPKKVEFLKELKDFLREQVAKSTNTGVNQTKFDSEDEKVATLSFVLLDKNKNKMWERKEWKMFRDMVTLTKNLRKCGKKMPRYCDVNNDKKITLSEWLSCLQTDQPSTALETAKVSKPTSSEPSPKLSGRNPLDSYLKE